MIETRRSLKVALLAIAGVVMIGSFTTVSFYRPCGDVAAARHQRVVVDIRTLQAYLEAYRSKKGAYPKSVQGLGALALAETPTDPWTTEYVYRFPGKHEPKPYDLFSAGPDHEPDTPDDDWGE
jgi:general secretion pathway protein G